MKHPLPTTVLLLALFFAAQLIGLGLLVLNINSITVQDGNVMIEHGTTALGDRPQTQGFQSLLYLLLGVAIGTGLVLLLIKFKIFGIWKIWFLVAVWFSTTIAVGVLLPTLVALLICLGLAVWKVYWPNAVVHNLTEVFMYAGLAVLLVPIFSLFWVFVLLLIISVYDIIAVWHSKHMVVMAQAQTQSNVFAGLYVPKGKGMMLPPQKPKTSSQKSTGTSAAILGGGDIAFPLIFSGVVLDWLIMEGYTKVSALYWTIIISVTTTIALALLFFYAKKDRFYPAMPFLSAGTFIGFGIIALIHFLL